ncbi:anthranilate synthase component II [Oceanithermus sp.]
MTDPQKPASHTPSPTPHPPHPTSHIPHPTPHSPHPTPHLLLIDNYDSFTYNLADYLGQLGARLTVWRNDRFELEDVARLAPDAVVISPGPGTPEEAGLSIPLIKEYAPRLPILGVCLGHQAIGAAFGAKVVPAPRLMHGKTSPIEHSHQSIFMGLPDPFTATRYHSLVIDDLPGKLEVLAWTPEEGQQTIQAVRHVRFPTIGVQFHPESILTEVGLQLLLNWLGEVELFWKTRPREGEK